MTKSFVDFIRRKEYGNSVAEMALQQLNYAPASATRKKAVASLLGLGFNKMKARLFQSYVRNCATSVEKMQGERQINSIVSPVETTVGQGGVANAVNMWKDGIDRVRVWVWVWVWLWGPVLNLRKKITREYSRTGVECLWRLLVLSSLPLSSIHGRHIGFVVHKWHSAVVLIFPYPSNGTTTLFNEQTLHEWVIRTHPLLPLSNTIIQSSSHFCRYVEANVALSYKITNLQYTVVGIFTV